MVWGLPEGIGVLGRGGQRGKNRDNCNSITYKIQFKKIKRIKRIQWSDSTLFKRKVEKGGGINKQTTPNNLIATDNIMVTTRGGGGTGRE